MRDLTEAECRALARANMRKVLLAQNMAPVGEAVQMPPDPDHERARASMRRQLARQHIAV